MSELPEGIVSFLFTDIEGSTRLLHHLGSRYAGVLEEHRRLLRAAFVAHGGHEVNTQGDSFFVVFARACDAVAAAVAAQRALHDYSWPAGGTVRVRMGLHTGQSERAAGDYVGVDVHRAARLGAAGHGGQVLLSEVTHEAVQYALPEATWLRSLGRHQLRDMAQPERIYQLIVADLPTEFPSLHTIDLRPNNLPSPVTELLGRSEQVAAATQRLRRPAVRLLTFTGVGGTGKTRLALQVAADLLGDFGDGAFLVALASVRDPALVIPTISQSLTVTEIAGQSLLDSLKQHLKEKQILLVLDNFEHLLPAALEIAELLATCPQLKVLVTSRIPLHLSGEHELPVPPLALPDLQQMPSVELLSRIAAVELFVQRAQAVKMDFILKAANAAEIAAICTRLDGLPLAIELAAPRVRMLAPHAILAGLDKRLQTLIGGAHDLPQRHQTLRECIVWSYNLLEADERALLERLAVFVGGCDLEAAQAILNTAQNVNVLDDLWALKDKSLILATEQDGQPRFSMLETIREFAVECLEASGEANLWRERHADYFLRLVEQAESQLSGSTQVEWLQYFEREADNLRAALRWTMREKPQNALRLVGTLWHIWPTDLRDLNEEILHLARARGDRRATAASLGHMGYAELHAGRYTTAQSLFAESLELSRLLGEEWYTIRPLFGLGRALTRIGDLDRAQEYLREVLQLIVKMQFPVATAYMAAAFGYLAAARGNWEQAVRLLATTQVACDAMASPFLPEDQSIYDQYLEAAQQVLDEATFAAAWQQGSAVSGEQFLQSASNELP